MEAERLVVGRIIQPVFGLTLIRWSIIGVVPMLQEKQAEVIMAGVLYRGAFLVGLDILGRGVRKNG